jgi:hypothetical protein
MPDDPLVRFITLAWVVFVLCMLVACVVLLLVNMVLVVTGNG